MFFSNKITISTEVVTKITLNLTLSCLLEKSFFTFQFLGYCFWHPFRWAHSRKYFIQYIITIIILKPVNQIWPVMEVLTYFIKCYPPSPSNFRPISFLSLVSKLLEKHILYIMILLKHCHQHDLQFGFLPNHSTTTALLYMYTAPSPFSPSLSSTTQSLVSSLTSKNAFKGRASLPPPNHRFPSHFPLISHYHLSLISQSSPTDLSIISH